MLKMQRIGICNKNQCIDGGRFRQCDTLQGEVGGAEIGLTGQQDGAEHLKVSEYVEACPI